MGGTCQYNQGRVSVTERKPANGQVRTIVLQGYCVEATRRDYRDGKVIRREFGENKAQKTCRRNRENEAYAKRS